MRPRSPARARLAQGPLRQAGDHRTIAALEVILAEEVRHVEIGTRWFHYCCERAGVDPDATFLRLLDDPVEGARKLAAGLETDSGDLQERVDLLSFYIAQDLGKCKEAVSSLETFLAAHPESVMRRGLQRTLNALKQEETCT